MDRLNAWLREKLLPGVTPLRYTYIRVGISFGRCELNSVESGGDGRSPASWRLEFVLALCIILHYPNISGRALTTRAHPGMFALSLIAAGGSSRTFSITIRIIQFFRPAQGGGEHRGSQSSRNFEDEIMPRDLPRQVSPISIGNSTFFAPRIKPRTVH